MTQPRRNLVSLDDTPYYHCVARCVRRAFLCGEDRASGQSFEHRRQWIVDRMRELADIFAIDICAYAVMSNHYHVVLRVDVEQAEAWSTHSVVARWHCLFRGTLLSQRFIRGDELSSAESEALEERVSIWRERLMNISWFMKELNEFIAREANKEDRCKGCFWEGRFKSQALLDTTALLACMAYVDLNPVRAKMADTIESSDFTSIQERLFAIAKQRKRSSKNLQTAKHTKLLPFVEAEHANADPKCLPFTLKNYIELVDYTGRVVKENKRGAISTNTPNLLDKLGLDAHQWQLLAIDIQRQSLAALGSLEQLEIYHASLNKKWMSKQSYLKHCYPSTA